MAGFPRGRPSLKRVALIDQIILDVALQHFIQFGPCASISQIVKATGMSKTTFYARYPSKKHLFQALINEQTDQVTQEAPLADLSKYSGIQQGLIAFR